MLLEKGNIKLRAVELTDLDVLYAWENNPSVWNVSQTISPFSKYTLKEYCTYSNTDILTTKQLRFMIDFKESGKTITVGAVDLFEYDPINRRAGIGILIGNEKYRKKGIASKSIEIFIEYAFSILNLHQIHCFISEKNKASLELFSKLKFTKKGLINDWILHSNKWENVYFLQRINK
jgi:diamine N-acetyltransferase